MENCEKFCTHLVPAFERILPPLHQIALTDPRDTEVDSRAMSRTYVHLLQVVHHFPVIGLRAEKGFVCFLKQNCTNNQISQTLEFTTLKTRQQCCTDDSVTSIKSIKHKIKTKHFTKVKETEPKINIKH